MDKMQVDRLPRCSAGSSDGMYFRAPVVVTVLFAVIFALAGSKSLAAAGINTAGDEPGAADAVDAMAGFPVQLNGNWTGEASVALADLNGDGVDEIIVGGRDGKVHAYTGAGARLWDFDTGNMAVSGKAAVADIDGDGTPEVVVGAGSTFTFQSHGGLYVLDHLGQLQCAFQPGNFNSDSWRDGVHSSPTLADIDGNDGGLLEIVFGGWDAYVRVLNHDCSPVWSVYVRDTIWSSPAVADLDRDGRPEVIIGVDTHDEPYYGTTKGGQLHVYNHAGAMLPGFPKQVDEVIFSSPAIGDIDGDGWLDIVVGTGDFWGNPACDHPDGCSPGVGRYVSAWDRHGNPLPGWPRPTGAYVWASPALGDMDGDGVLEVVINSSDGYVHVWNGDGSYVPGWPQKPVTPAGVGITVSMATLASPLLVDVDGNGALEVVLPSNWELVIWSRNGQQMTRNIFPHPQGTWSLHTTYTIGGTPAAGDIDGDGDLDLVSGGALGSDATGAIYAWDFRAPFIADGSWPSLRHNATNGGSIAPTASVLPVDTKAFLVHTGDSRRMTEPFLVNVYGSGDLAWDVAADNPRRVQVANRGVDPATGQMRFDVTVDIAGLPAGVHDLGAVVIDATAGSIPAVGSPIQFPVRVMVGGTESLYVPVLMGKP